MYTYKKIILFPFYPLGNFNERLFCSLLSTLCHKTKKHYTLKQCVKQEAGEFFKLNGNNSRQ